MTGLCDGMVEAALSAAETILDIYDGEIDVALKGDETPVTKADKAAERIILAHLADLAPTVPVVAEEAVAEGHVPQIDGEFFLVDPLDGTKEFIRRNGEFTVNIAYLMEERPQIGIIYTPAKGWLFVGEVGKGAWRATVEDPRLSHDLSDKMSIAVRPCGKSQDVVGSRSHPSPQTEHYLQAIAVGEKKAIGSSLKFCLLAAGEADLYPRFGRTMEWDTAAGDAILTAAGGRVQTLDGTLLTYGKIGQADVPFANPNFIASGGVS